MGVYVVTGGSGGIGGKTVEILRSQGHETINVDLKGGDINANIATKEGRQDVIDKIYELHPEGIDGLICVAGVAGTCGDMKLMFSLNYFGVTSPLPPPKGIRSALGPITATRFRAARSKGRAPAFFNSTGPSSAVA